jgi:seryl-tRNA synthetase
MALFQNSVRNKYIKLQDQQAVEKSIKKVGGEKLTKTDEMDWMDVFETKKSEAQTLKTEIDKTDKDIDQMVYELYNLTAEEIQIVENS